MNTSEGAVAEGASVSLRTVALGWGPAAHAPV